MTMSRVDETFEVYMQMRIGGKQAKAVLEALRTRIETMNATDQAELVRRVKAWEGKHLGSVTAAPAQKSASTNSISEWDMDFPAKKQREPSDFAQSLMGSTPPKDLPKEKKADSAANAPASNPVMKAPSFSAKPPSSEEASKPTFTAPALGAKTIICSRCGKANDPNDVFCSNCGNFMRTDATVFETTRLDDPEMISHGADFFSPDSTLVLVVDGTSYSYKVQPQRYKHETVIGRSESTTMKPDIDLSQHNAGEMGVSRLHVALQYNAKNNLLSVSDMKSANGTFINGQKLYPQEVRVLRDGDELRLGRLVLRVYFQHGERKN